MFGGTLALLGAIKEQRADVLASAYMHCVEGCFGCEQDALYIFERWVLEQPPQRPIIRKERHT